MKTAISFTLEISLPLKLLGNLFQQIFIPGDFQSTAIIQKNLRSQNKRTCEAKRIKNSVHFNALISLTKKPRRIFRISEQIFLVLEFLLFYTISFSNCFVNLQLIYHCLNSRLISELEHISSFGGQEKLQYYPRSSSSALMKINLDSPMNFRCS